VTLWSSNSYIQLRQRDKKAEEILQSVSAFSNAAGGDLFLGISDHGEPKSMEDPLNKEYGAQFRGRSQRQDAYVRELKKWIFENTTPTTALEFNWHEFGEHLILQLRITKAPVPVNLVRDSEIFIRAGATNRRWRPSDAIKAHLQRS